jgi:hypothetical protein
LRHNRHRIRCSNVVSINEIQVFKRKGLRWTKICSLWFSIISLWFWLWLLLEPSNIFTFIIIQLYSSQNWSTKAAYLVSFFSPTMPSWHSISSWLSLCIYNFFYTMNNTFFFAPSVLSQRSIKLNYIIIFRCNAEKKENQTSRGVLLFFPLFYRYILVIA